MSANIKVLANLLKDEYVIQVASSGQRALEIAQGASPPDLILLDIVMPEMDGYAVCRALKNQPATNRIPIIFISALDEASDEARGLSLGAVDYISKPYHAEIVRARIRNHMSLKLKTDLLENMSYIDGLTQVANRRHFDATLQAEIRRLARSGKPLGLILLDIDHFKLFNDNYGHGRGDECLVKVAAALQQVVARPGDLFARYGGEEFVALLPGMEAQAALQAAEAVRHRIQEEPVRTAKAGIRLSVSVGVHSLVPERALSPEEVIAIADEALYRAKRDGRNCVRHSVSAA